MGEIERVKQENSCLKEKIAELEEQRKIRTTDGMEVSFKKEEK